MTDGLRFKTIQKHFVLTKGANGDNEAVFLLSDVHKLSQASVCTNNAKAARDSNLNPVVRMLLIRKELQKLKIA